VIEQAIETAALMLGSDKSRGYCLEMICADFLAGANLDSGQPDVLLSSMARLFEVLPGEQRQSFIELITEKHHESNSGKEFSPPPPSPTVRRAAPAGVTPGQMEMPELRRTGASRGASSGAA